MMRSLLSPSLVALAVTSLCAQAQAQSLELSLLDAVQPGEKIGEVVSWSPTDKKVLSTVGEQGLWHATLGAEGLGEGQLVDLSGQVEDLEEVTSVATHPSGKVRAVAIVRERGQVGLIALIREGAEPELVEIGHHPDCVTFSQDGKFILAACEAEFPEEEGEDFAGSLAVIELDEAQQVTATNVYDFSAANLADGVTLEGLRNHAPDQDIALSVEPEYVSELDGTVWVSLQEANGLGGFDLATRKWTVLAPLGTIEQTIDGTKGDKAANIDDSIHGLPMPDTIAAFEHDGKVWIATANEGDARPDDGDVGEVAEMENLDETNVPAALRTEAELGEMEVSNLDGDTDGDGDIDQLTMFGTRSWTLWTPSADGKSIKLGWDSGALEAPLFELDPKMHNVNRDKLKIDNRSDDKGPEPEALAVGEIDGQKIVFVGLERQNGITAWHLPTGGAPKLIGYINEAKEGRISPETLVFIPAEESPTSAPLLLVGFEGGKETEGTIALYNLKLSL